MRKKPTKSRKDSGPKPPATTSSTLTRSAVAELLRCSVPTVRRMEGAELHPTADAEECTDSIRPR